MAIIKIKVPAHWPNFVVTSHHRPKDKGQHKIKFGAIDIAPQWDPLDRKKDSKYWFYYYQTFNLLVASMRQGKVRMAAPPECPHYHIDTRLIEPMFGVEWVVPVKGVCKYKAHWELHRNKFSEFEEGMRKIRVVLGKNYWSNIWNIWESVKYDFTLPGKYITVYGENEIDDDNLQKILDNVFGNGEHMAYILDEASKMIGFTNSTDAKEHLPSAGGFATVALLAVAAFFLIRSDRQ